MGEHDVFCGKCGASGFTLTSRLMKCEKCNKFFVLEGRVEREYFMVGRTERRETGRENVYGVLIDLLEKDEAGLNKNYESKSKDLDPDPKRVIYELPHCPKCSGELSLLDSDIVCPVCGSRLEGPGMKLFEGIV